MTVHSHQEVLVGSNRREPTLTMGLGPSLHLFEMLATMLSAGVSLVQALEALRRQPEFSQPLERTQRALMSGYSLSRSFALGGFRDPVVLALLQLGERTGTMEHVVRELASIFRWRYRLHAELRGRLTYPALLALACTVMVALGPPLMLRPILDFLRHSGAKLPLASQVLLALIDGLSSPVAWLALAAGLAGVAWSARELARRVPVAGERWLLERPILGACMSQLYTARFGRSLLAGLATGYPLPAAMELAASCTSSAVVGEQCQRACAALRNGESPEQAFAYLESLDPLLRSAVPLGLAMGAVESMLSAALRMTEEKLRHRVDDLLALLEPALLMLMGGGVALCILATVAPMMSLLQAVS